MALFPRNVDGKYLALCRGDGESISLASLGRTVDHGTCPRYPCTEPTVPWEMLQVGNCGPPIET